MKSLSKLFRIGPGPSSSHTIAIYNAAQSFSSFLDKDVDHVKATFYSSLGLTAKGHHSDFAVEQALSSYPVEFAYDHKTQVEHPLTMRLEAYKGSLLFKKCDYVSLGGGEIKSDDDPRINEKDIYPFRNLEEILEYMKKEGLSSFKDFCLRFEDPSIDGYLVEVLNSMFSSIERGLSEEGKIPANNNPKLQVNRSAKSMYEVSRTLKSHEGFRTLTLSSFAYAVAESSACGEKVVTAPTCGSSGVLPSLLYWMHKEEGHSIRECVDSLYAAGVFGNIVKQNASIAGSIGGCQAEIGTASSMGAAALASIDKLSLHQIEYGAEVAMEHFLGLSCDPVDGYVIIPCIERNGIGSIRAYTSYLYAKFVSPIRMNQVSFDAVVAAMKMTGSALKKAYKETAQGGLAEILKSKGRK